MISQPKCIESTPSVYFNFEQSNMKSDQCQEYIPYQYSNSTHHHHEISSPYKNKMSVTITPLIRKSTIQNNIPIEDTNKLDTEQFFQDFDHNFIVKFEDQSPLKCQFSKHLDFNMLDANQEDQYPQKQNNCKIIIRSNNSSQCNSLKGQQNVNNQESADNKKQNAPTKTTKFTCEVRKRVLFKTGQSLTQKSNIINRNTKIINDKNLMIVTSSNWSGIHTKKPAKQAPFSQPIKSNNPKTLNENIFNTYTGFRQTLRSTTLDNWKKKHLFSKNRKYFSKNTKKSHNIFEKPFSLIR